MLGHDFFEIDAFVLVFIPIEAPTDRGDGPTADAAGGFVEEFRWV